MKKVLIITYYWPPSGGAGVQRFLKFAKYLPHFDVDPIILTCSNPTYPIIDESLESEIPKNIRVFKSRTIEPFGIFGLITGKSKEQVANPSTVLNADKKSFFQKIGSFIRANLFIPDARIGWRYMSRRHALELIDEFKIETIITTGPPHSVHLLGKDLATKRPVKWIADFRDPWVEIHYNKALPRTRLANKIDASLEESVLQRAHQIVVTANGTASLLQSKTSRPVTIIPNGFDYDDFTEVKASTQNDVFTIRHVGSITETSVPANLLEALSLIKEAPYKLEFIGECHPQVKSLVQRFGLESKVSFHDYKPHSVATALMQTADLNLVVVHRSDESEGLVPGKLYDYLRSGKPILVISPKNGDASRIAKKSGLGFVFDHSAVNDLKTWIEDFIKNPSNPEPNTDFIQSFSRKSLTQRLAELL